MSVNTTSVLLALQHAVAGFRTLPASATIKTFIFTGNVLNLVTVPGVLTFGITKSATAYAIRSLVDTKVYQKDGIRCVLLTSRLPCHLYRRRTETFPFPPFTEYIYLGQIHIAKH